MKRPRAAATSPRETRPRPAAPLLEPDQLSLTQLALFVGQAADEQLLEQLRSAGFQDIKVSHGYVVQHLLGGPRAIGELAALLGVTQQAASKTAAEMVRAGYAELIPGEDARVRQLRLSERGAACVERARSARKRLEARLSQHVGSESYEDARRTLGGLLDALGGSEAVRKRRVRMPR
ncbi:MAG TPA: MarR family transcriptional regulator [Polyangiaceae bacterium]|nr:MarR family transcriptional regulator [Polyangiaceae bacterium]